MDQILRAEHVNFVPGLHDLKPAELGVALYWRDKETGLPKFDGTNLPTKIAAGKHSTAHCSHGRWVVDCITPGCHAAVYASPADPRMFCTHCDNAGVKGKWIIVDFPVPKVLAEIERLLLLRPLMENRNWFPYESVAHLAQENLDHGLPA